MNLEAFIIVASFSSILLVCDEKYVIFFITQCHDIFVMFNNFRLFTTQTFLLESPLCPQLKNLCSNLLPGTDDLIVLECIQTFQTSQFESINNECQNIIHSRIMDLITNEQSIFKMS